MARVLIIEDSPEAQALVRVALANHHQLQFAETGHDGVRQAIAMPPDLALIDVGLPDVDGFELCNQLKSNPVLENVPVIFLTGRKDTSDKVMAFKLGAEDYICKPFEAAELRCRIDARLDRERAARDRIAYDEFTLDVIRQKATVQGAEGDRPCDLTPHEFRILHGLAARRGMVLTRSQLIEAGWGGVAITERTVDTHVSNLRRKLGPVGGLIESVRGVGYRLASRPARHTESVV